MSEALHKLVVLHTNDIHSHFEEMPKIAAYFREMRKKLPADRLLVVDIGDHMDRMRLETEGSGGVANVEVLNASGYEAFVPGNNEGLTFPAGLLAEAFRGRTDFPVICSNLFEGETGRIPDWMVPYHIVQKGPLQVGLVGVTAQFTDFYELLGWNVSDPLEAAARWVGWLRPQVDLVIVLSHLGLRLDERMAAEVPGIDLILGGHTHHVLEQPLRIGGTYVCAAGKFGKYVGEVEVTFDMTAGRIVDVNGRCVDVSKLDGDPEMSGMIARFRESGRAALQVTVAHLEEPLPLDWQRESDLGNLLAAGLKHWADAEIGLVNAGQVLEGLAPGKVTKGRLLEICPGPINPCRLRLRGEHLRQALEECLLPEFTEKPIRGFGFRGSVLGTLCVDGLRIEYDDSREPYRKLTDVRLDSGEPLDPEKEYVVGTIDMFTFGAGYLSLSKGTRVEYLLPEFLRDVLAVELQSADNIRQCRVRRWRAK